MFKNNKILQEKFRIAFEEGVENERWKKEGIEIQNNQKDNINPKETSKTQRKTNSKISKSFINNGISKLIKNSKGSIRYLKQKVI